MSTLAANPPVQLRAPNEGIQFVHGGFFPLGESPPEAMSHESALPTIRQDEPAARFPRTFREGPAAPHREQAPMPALPGNGVPAQSAHPRDVLRLAKARIKELRAFMREAAKAKKELAQLERLVAAAKSKPLRLVSDNARRATG